ncbi:hypothetical protein RE6C_02976 [Rhodopirellula europaea 6C]|uniref:Uncharacterized protein n=1 Tax=Rhodopirellula europaea 6C TaxID=1263867 RepID=M2B3C3_9BACT|nr:hypothetical protein RE6C_02976 [Rhodopirellula europaea 6C]
MAKQLLRHALFLFQRCLRNPMVLFEAKRHPILRDRDAALLAST